MSSSLQADGVVCCPTHAVGAKVGLEPGVDVEDVVDDAAGLAGFVVLDLEFAQLHLVVDAGGAGAAGDGIGVVGEGACQLVGGGLDFGRNQRAGQVDAVNRVVFAGPLEGLGGGAAVAVERQGVDPAGGGDEGAVLGVVGLIGPGGRLRRSLEIGVGSGQRYVAVGRGSTNCGVDRGSHGLIQSFLEFSSSQKLS